MKQSGEFLHFETCYEVKRLKLHELSGSQMVLLLSPDSVA